MFMAFNDAARLALRLADLDAHWFLADAVGTEHLLLALAHLHGCVAVRVLNRANIACCDVRREVLQQIVRGPGGLSKGRRPFTPGAQKAVACALAAADRLGHARTGTGHLLLGLLEEAEGVAYRVLHKLGIGRLGRNLSRVAEHVTAEMKRGFPWMDA
jgi:ATP-dependent Clp protease ATP-binding subunit ClpC